MTYEALNQLLAGSRFSLERGTSDTPTGRLPHTVVLFKDCHVAWVSETATFSIDTHFYHFEILPEGEKEWLLGLLVAYAGTPIDNRRVTKRYYLRLPHVDVAPENLIQHNDATGEWYSLSTQVGNGSRTKVIFTTEEIAEITNPLIRKLIDTGALLKIEYEHKE